MKLKHLFLTAVLAGLTFSAAPVALAQPNPPNPPNPPNLPNPPNRPAWLEDMIAQHQAAQQQIVAARQALAASLGELSAAERRAAIEAFQEEHADALAAQRALADEIRRAARELNGAHDRPERERPETTVQNRPELSNDVRALTNRFHAEREELLQKLREATAEERQAALDEWREARAAIIEEIRETARANQPDVADLIEDRRNNR